MDVKYNESTRNRPEGERVIDASFLYADLKAFRDQLKDEKAWKKNDRNGITLFKSTGLTIVLVMLKKDAEVPDNELKGFFTVQVLDGSLDARIGEQLVQAGTGLLVLHPGIRHSLRALSDSLVIFTHYRQDTTDTEDGLPY